MNEKEKKPLVAVVGPTASGKTGLAIALCKAYDGEVVSADSMQIYKYMDIGTAKPSKEEMQGIPHHMMDFLEPNKSFSVAQYVACAREVIADIHARGKLPVLVGGTGLYVDSLLQNIQFSEVPNNPALRAELAELAAQKTPQEVWEMLEQIDPQTAQILHPNNQGRVLRAIEIYRLTGISMWEHQRRSKSVPSPYKSCVLGIGFEDRELMYQKINKRVDLMMEQGLLQEVQTLAAMGFSPTAVQAIGYKELFSYLEGTASLPACVETLKQETRKYAKRQMTWFRRNPDIEWVIRDEKTEELQILEKSYKFVAKAAIL